MKNIITIIAALGLCVPVIAADEELFRAGELTVDLAASYNAAQPEGFSEVFQHSIRHGDYGLSIGPTLWMTKYLGVGVGATLIEEGSSFLDQTHLTLHGRYPIGHFAPYALGGAGCNWNDDEDGDMGKPFWQVGGGVEYRFTRHLAVFSEVRYLFETNTDDELQFRVGIRLADIASLFK